MTRDSLLGYVVLNYYCTKIWRQRNFFTWRFEAICFRVSVGRFFRRIIIIISDAAQIWQRLGQLVEPGEKFVQLLLAVRPEALRRLLLESRLVQLVVVLAASHGHAVGELGAAVVNPAVARRRLTAVSGRPEA